MKALAFVLSCHFFNYRDLSHSHSHSLFSGSRRRKWKLHKKTRENLKKS